MDDPDDLVATAVEFKEPSLITFDEQDDYSDLDNAIANAEKYQVKDHAFFEDKEDEFKELNESLVAVAAEGKVMVKENDVAMIETFPIESAEIEELPEVPIKVDEPRKPLPFKDMVAIAKPSEPIVQTRPSKPVKPSEPIGKPEITNNPGPLSCMNPKSLKQWNRPIPRKKNQIMLQLISNLNQSNPANQKSMESLRAL